MSVTTWETTDGRLFEGEKVAISFDTPGDHTITKKTPGKPPRNITVKTTATLPYSWTHREQKLPTGFRTHSEEYTSRDVGFGRTEWLPRPTAGKGLGPIPWSGDRNNPEFVFASDLGPATTEFERLVGAAMSPTLEGAKYLILDHLKADGSGADYNCGPAFSDHYFSSINIGEGSTRWIAGSVASDVGNGATQYSGVGYLKGIIGTNGQRILMSTSISDRRQRYWLNESIDNSELVAAGGVKWEDGKSISVTPTMLGNRQTAGSNSQVTFLVVNNVPGFVLANLEFWLPGGASDGDLPVRAWSGVKFSKCSDWIVSHCRFVAFSKGWDSIPPGESSTIGAHSSEGRFFIGDTEILGRRPNGTRVAGGPLNFSNMRVDPSTSIQRCYFGGQAHGFYTDHMVRGRRDSIDVIMDDSPGQAYNAESSWYQKGTNADTRNRHRFIDCKFGKRPSANHHVAIRAGDVARDSRGTFVEIINPVITTPGYYTMNGNETLETGYTFCISSPWGYRDIQSNWVVNPGTAPNYGRNPCAIEDSGFSENVIGGGMKVWRTNVNGEKKELQLACDRVEEFDATTRMRLWKEGVWGVNGGEPTWKSAGPADAFSKVWVNI